MNFNLILSHHQKNLESVLQGEILYGLAPNLSVNQFQLGSDDLYYNEKYDHPFYVTSVLNIRIKNKENKKVWLALSPGSDSSEESWNNWGAYRAELLPQANFGNTLKDTRWHEEIKKEKPEINENDFLDIHHTGMGMTRLNLWTSKIIAIELYLFGLYVACIFYHEDNTSWATYAEYDFLFWISFNPNVINYLRKTGTNKLMIQ